MHRLYSSYARKQNAFFIFFWKQCNNYHCWLIVIGLYTTAMDTTGCSTMHLFWNRIFVKLRKVFQFTKQCFNVHAHKSLKCLTREALTRGRTDRFAAGVTYLRFPIQVCFSSTLPDLVYPVPPSHFQPKKRHFPIFLSWPWTFWSMILWPT